MPQVLGIAGPAGEEKSMLIRSLAQALAARGLRLGLALAGGETRTAGDDLPTLRATPQGWSVSGPQPPSLDEMVARHFSGVDLVLSELHLDQRFLKIEYCPEGHVPTLDRDPGMRAFICQAPSGASLPCFNLDDVQGLAEHLAVKVLPPSKPHAVRILIDGKRIPAKDFVEQIVAGTIRAMVSSLRGAEKAERMEIHL